MKVVSAGSNFELDKVVDRLDSGLLYVDQGTHTPVVVIKRAFNGINGLFGWENYPEGDTEYSIRCYFRFSVSLKTATASLTSYHDFRKRMINNIEQLTGKAPGSKSVHPEGNISKEQLKDPMKMGLKIKTVLQLNRESRSKHSPQIREESNTSKRMKTEEEEMEIQTNLAISEKKDLELEPIKSQDEKFIKKLSEKKCKHSRINDRQPSKSPPKPTSPGPNMTSTDNSSSACDSETDSRLEQAYDPFTPLSPCGSVSPYDPASPTESATSDSSVELLEPKCLAKRLKKLARKRKGSFDVQAPPIIFCPDIPPNAETFGEIDTYASFLETEDDANMSSMSPPQDEFGSMQTVGELDLKVGVTCESKNGVKESIKKEADSLSCKSERKRRSKAKASGEKERLDKILEEAKTALKPSLVGGQISKGVYAKILTKAIPKIYYSKSKEINKPKIRRLIQEYVKKYHKVIKSA